MFALRFWDIAVRRYDGIITHPAGYSKGKCQRFSEKPKKYSDFVEIT